MMTAHTIHTAFKSTRRHKILLASPSLIKQEISIIEFVLCMCFRFSTFRCHLFCLLPARMFCMCAHVHSRHNHFIIRVTHVLLLRLCTALLFRSPPPPLPLFRSFAPIRQMHVFITLPNHISAVFLLSSFVRVFRTYARPSLPHCLFNARSLPL